MAVTVTAHPSLALAKYWGKVAGGANLPATTSVALTLQALTTCTTVTLDTTDRVVIDGAEQPLERFLPVLDRIREALAASLTTEKSAPRFSVTSSNNFPTAAGLASSASGFAALVAAALHAGGGQASAPAVSRIARVGSGSACRSAFGGFTRWEATAREAVQIADETWWPDLRVVVLPVSAGPKEVSSRDAMNRTRDTSPYYPAWITDAPGIAREVEEGIRNRDIQRLGDASRLSYLRMFATMLSAAPPVVYWLSGSVQIIHELEGLRRQGVPAWETMDAGPQVKVLTDAAHADDIARRFAPLTSLPPVVSGIGPGPAVVDQTNG